MAVHALYLVLVIQDFIFFIKFLRSFIWVFLGVILDVWVICAIFAQLKQVLGVNDLIFVALFN